MIGALWNVRGLNKEGRLQCIADFVKDNKLNFVGLQETKKKVFRTRFSHLYTETLIGNIFRHKILREVFWWVSMKESLMS